jgi:hypothetical protein
MHIRRRNSRVAALAVLMSTALVGGGLQLARASTAWNVGDVFLGVGGLGDYQVYDARGALKETVSQGEVGYNTQCAFNPAQDRLYTLSFSSNLIVVFAAGSPHAIVAKIPTHGFAPQSLVFDTNGDFYVGYAASEQIDKYSPTGALLATWPVPAEIRATDWIDLGADQKTIWYTSQGRQIKRWDTSTGEALTDFTTLPGPAGSGTGAGAIRLLPPGDGSGGLLIADAENIKRLDGAGNIVQTYDLPEDLHAWFSMALDPNGTSFWAGDYGLVGVDGTVARFNIQTGAVEVGPIHPGVGDRRFHGTCVMGELTSTQQPSITLTPATANNPAGTAHTLTATVLESGSPKPSVAVSFAVTAGPNAGTTGTCATNANCLTDGSGHVSWTYTSNGTMGTDTIRSCLSSGPCATAQKTWVQGDSNQPPSVSSGGAVSGQEGTAIPLAGSVSDPDRDPVTTHWTYSATSADQGATCSFADASAVDTSITCTDDGAYSVVLTGTDDRGAQAEDRAIVTVTNVAPTVSITAPTDGALYAINAEVSVASSLTDRGRNDTHSCSIDWGDSSSNAVGAVSEVPGSGTCTATHKFTAAGVYTVAVTVTDDDAATATDEIMVVVFDPSAGFVTGGGWINSSAGAYTPQPTLMGRANFGFVSKYLKNATVPTGSTEFQFQAGNLNFHSDSYQWLVVSGSRAQYKGTGTLNGLPGYGFLLTVNDGQLTDGRTVDALRIKIWETAGETTVYDNAAGLADLAVSPLQQLSEGSIMIHKAR